VKEVGPERILFGSDIPFGTTKRELDKILALNINDQDKGLILSENLRRLTGLEPLKKETYR
jgi:predicted TIM-barrel fold metal-dependent hydrolase